VDSSSERVDIADALAEPAPRSPVAPDELEVDQTEVSDDADTDADTLRFDIASYPADYTVKVLVEKWRDEQLVIPEFQRAYVWTLPQASKLIESFLIGLPVPQVFLYKDRETQKLLVVDGHQRLKTLVQFYDQQFGESRVFRLLGVHPRWQGKRYSDLDEPDRLRLDDSPLRSIVVQQLSPDDQESIYLIFERLNAGGVKLNPMEIRKTVFHGPAIQLIERLNLDANWRALLGLREPEPRLRDAELVVRVLALASRWREYTKPMKTFLTRYMESLARLSDAERADLGAKFEVAAQTALAALGDRPFNLRGRLNVAALDVTLGALIEAGTDNPERVAATYTSLVGRSDFLQNVYFNTSDVQVLKARFQDFLDSLASGG
jgi:hypothetical protein